MLELQRGYSYDSSITDEPPFMVDGVEVLNSKGRRVAHFDADYDEEDRDAHLRVHDGPVSLGRSGGRYWWITLRYEYSQPTGNGGFNRVDEVKEVFTADRALEPSDVEAFLLVRARKNEQELQRVRTLATVPTQDSAERHGARERIPDQVKIFVWQRDSGQCVYCGTNADLEFDHIIPLVMGGSNTERNLQLLCGTCNRAKGGNLV